jgi:hypothetical protein
MSTSNLTLTGTAALPSATNAVLGGVQIPTVSGLSVDDDGNLSINVGSNLDINESTGKLEITSDVFLTISSAEDTYLPLTGGDVDGTLNIGGALNLLATGGYDSNIAFVANDTGAFINFNVGQPTLAGGIIFTDSSIQSTAFNPYNTVFNGATANTYQMYYDTDSSDTVILEQGPCTHVINLSTYPSPLNIVFPTPTADGYYIELVITNGGAGGYSFSGKCLDGSSPASVEEDFGTTSYEKGGFRFFGVGESSGTWYQVV